MSLHYVRSGRGTFKINDKEYQLSAGDFFLIPSNVPVIYYRNEADPWRYFWLAFSENTLFDCEKLLGMSIDNPVRKAGSPQIITSLFDSLFENEPPGPLYFNTLSFLMKMIDAEQPRTPSATSLYSPENIIEKTKHIIELNYMYPDFSVSSICNVLCISQQHLCRLFKKSTGITPVAYLADKRISNAAKLLEYSDFPIHVLSEKCGFENDAYFMRCFKKRFGVTVKEYRKNLLSQKAQVNINDKQ
mgnify:CR=1 FL=1